jgi:Tol biopolymer transport system component
MRSEIWSLRVLICLSLPVLAVPAAAQNELIGWGDPGPSSTVPLPPAGLNAVQVKAASDYCAALLSDGSILAWGDNSSGQTSVPALPAGLRYVQVALGAISGLARRSDGSVVGWGDNSYGQLNVPALPAGVRYTDIAAGPSHSLACRSDGVVLAWGVDYSGETQVPPLPAGMIYTRVAANNRWSMALRSDGQIAAFGSSTWNQLAVPVLPAGLRYVEIAAADEYGIALRSDGAVVGWVLSSNAPTPPTGLRYTAISAYVGLAMALRSDGQLITWGIGPFSVRAIPALPPGQSYLAVGMGLNFCTAIRGTPASTTRVSVDSAGREAHGPSWKPSLSADGRYVAFYSFAPDLAPGGGDPYDVYADVFVHDRVTGQTTCITTGGDSHSGDPMLSADGRFVAFGSYATNLVPGDTNLAPDVFLQDRTTGTTVRVSVDSTGAQANLGAGPGAISADGRFVAFESRSTNLIAVDTKASSDIFVRDVQAGTTTLVSVSTNGTLGNQDSFKPQLSADGRFVAFESYADNLVSGDTNSLPDIFVRDRLLGTTTRVSLGLLGAEGDGECHDASISWDGRYVAFASGSTNLVLGDSNGMRDIFVHDRQSGATLRASVASNGGEGNGDSFRPALSASGRFIAFFSAANTLVASDTNDVPDVFVHDLQGGTTERVSVESLGLEAFPDLSENPAISADGRFVAFESRADNLVREDQNLQQDVFVRDWAGVLYSAFGSFCHGDGSSVACPCANSGSTGQGCGNSFAFGGARLSASGNPSVGADSLLLSSAYEPPSALSFVVQGTSIAPATRLGDGLLCTAGTLRLMYMKLASAGAVNVPGPGDPKVWARSAALGDVIHIGDVRFYQVLYVDSSMSFCPWPQGALSNVTNGIVVAWGI